MWLWRVKLTPPRMLNQRLACLPVFGGGSTLKFKWGGGVQEAQSRKMKIKCLNQKGKKKKKIMGNQAPTIVNPL